MGYNDDSYLDQNKDFGPGGPTTLRTPGGKWETTYKLGGPLDERTRAMLQANVAGAGEGGGVRFSPDGRTMTITAAKTESNLWKVLAIAGAALATAGVAATAMSGTAPALGAGTSMAGGTGAGVTIPTFGSTAAAGTGVTIPTFGAAAAAPAAGVTIPTFGGGAAAGLAGTAAAAAPAVVPPAVDAAKKAGIFDRILGVSGKMKDAGLDPKVLALGAMSLMGGDDGPKPFTGSVDPQRLLEDATGKTNALYSQLQNNRPTRLRASYSSPVTAPINLPPINGKAIQIGGGLGHDPAIPFEENEPMTPQTPVRRREPR